ncbi:MAG: sensor domain-containing protein [Rhodanobacteraceae bacterium]|nr:sensor domain-containing protein [Xanthomonadales bacterium]MCP5477721.1 sensor domain-containing protein [Rhodanobacteraceae bacterium]HPF73484.1 sensor domain-containing protein [Xanthomonadaceae bacterium]HRY00938.1 sensor domain-containing protein [Xanthomonadaceae bacterium]
MNATPNTLDDYLKALREALRGADPALVQDALYDAEEHIRTMIAERPGTSEAEVLAEVAGSYGAPDEVADIYRDTEIKITRALKPPPPRPASSPLARVLAIYTDPSAYGALFYMLLALATGVFYFSWTTTGIGLSLGFAILIIGLPFLVLFIGSLRLLMLIEGRLVETLLGQRMPRRPAQLPHQGGWLARIGAMFSDPRTWIGTAYLLLMMPLGIVYFTLTTVVLSSAFSIAFAPLIEHLVPGVQILTINDWHPDFQLWMLPFTLLFGAVVLTAYMHLARGIGRLHGKLAKHMLVRPSAD